MRLLFTLTLFVSAALLFSIQPMIAKMLLPTFGGAPAVWNTCMVFFQAALLAGYGYAHAATTRLAPRRQVLLHGGLLLAPLLALPLAVSPDWVPPAGADPIFWLLGLLAVSAGLPFFVVAASAPLLQRWFAGTANPEGKDPYFLYAASNLGSLLALLGYPLLLEPNLRLTEQTWLWAAGYALLVLLMWTCAAVVWRSAGRASEGNNFASAEKEGKPPADPEIVEPLTPGRRLRWVALAFAPSSLMLGLTTYLSTDIAAFPLLWVVPLALYLLSFTIVFSRRPLLPHSWGVRVFPLLVILWTLFFCVGSTQPIWIPFHLLTFFVVALVCHGELAKDRPPPCHLTEFYLWMSVGGVLGGLFNALVAPLVFDRVIEYPLALVLACLLRPGPEIRLGKTWLDRALHFGPPLAIGTAAAVLLVSLPAFQQSTSFTQKFVVGFLVSLCYPLESRPLPFALGIGAVLLASGLAPTQYGRVLERERNFFAVLRVTEDLEGHYHQLIHGNTLHGRQSVDPARRREPLTYYHRSGPIGQVLEVFQQKPPRSSVAVVGLGAGSLACYARPDEQWTFYEIDPAVERVARDPRFFTFLQDCRARELTVTLGDARLRLREAPDHCYGLLILDAFSSDAIPVHLLTREALSLYRKKLADGGILAFHVSNLYLDLNPVLGALARDANLVCLSRVELTLENQDLEAGKTSSHWVVMARSEADLGRLAADPRWEPLPGQPGAGPWTDDFSNVFSIIRWH